MGRALRKRRIDEFPQLINVIRGDMSLVGPRPEVPEYVNLQNSQWQTVLQARPGLTGPDSLVFRKEGEELELSGNPDEYYRDTILPKKLALQAQYVQERSFSGDLDILFRTFGALWR